MLYRKAPAQPPRLLLRVVAVAGSGTLLAATACSNCQQSTSSGLVAESVANPELMYADTTVEQAVDGVAEMPEAGSGGPSGVVAQPDGDEDSSSAVDGPLD